MPKRLLAALLLPLLAACDRPAPRDETASAAATSAAATPAERVRGRVAAHWFGRQWPKNYLAGFRREDVAGDFAALRADGFDTVVLLVAWGDFQPVYSPCCGWDERAFERLHFLLDRADEAGLRVMLRLGYGWSFHPDAGDIGERQQRVLNDPEARAAFHAFLARIARETAGRDIALAFLSWEDLWLRRVDDSAADDYAAYLATLPPDPARPSTLPDPVRAPELFHGYWDWLLTERFVAPAAALFPAFSLEARIDAEPRYEPGPDGQPAITGWIGHAGMMRLPEGQPPVIYWAPFWGAANQGEQLPASRALELFDALLAQSAERSGGRPVFVDQFNVVDNTPGYEHNAIIRPAEVPAFLHAVACTMKARDVLGYGWWTTRDYAESPLHNPAFGYGLEGWTLARADGAAPESALEGLPSGDFQLALRAGDTLAQQVPPRRGRLPRAGDALPDRACVEAEVREPGTLSLSAGGDAVALAFDAPGRQRRCAGLAPMPGEDGLPVRLRLASGALALREVQVFDHVQYGGLYDLEGQPGPVLEPLRRLNRDFRAGAARCD